MALDLGPIHGVRLAGAGTAFPQRSLSNLDVLTLLAPQLWPEQPVPDAERLAFMAQGIEQTLGVRTRAWSHVPGTPFDHQSETSTLDLAIAASQQALLDANMQPAELGAIFCSTSTPARMTSTLSAVIGARLGSGAACMDLRTGCSAGLFALAQAALLVQHTQRPALVIGTETFSKVLPPAHKPAALTLADGAGAVILAPGSGSLLAAALATDGTLAHLVSAPAGLPPRVEDVEAGGFYLHGSPEELMAELPGKYRDAIARVLERSGIPAADISRYVPHQTSPALIASVAASFGIPAERCFVNVASHANVGAAGWLCALAEARAEQALRPGERVLLAAVGGGMSWAAALLEI